MGLKLPCIEFRGRRLDSSLSFLILFTGDYPHGLYDFGAAVLGWLIRVEAYVLLMVDEYPPFAFE